MSEDFWKIIRYALPYWAAMAAILTYYLTGLSVTTWGLAILATALLLTWRVWSDYWIKRFELPAYRREARHYASVGICGILFLRPFAVDQYWRELQEFVLAIVRAHNAQYAGYNTVVAIGGDDDGALAKLATAEDDWWSKVRSLAGNAEAIVILPIHPAAKSKSGLVQEIVHVLVQHPDKTIFVMPPRAVWDRDLKDTPLAGQLERLWAEMMEHLQQISPWITLLPYKPVGCFWTLHKGYDDYKATTYPYSQEGAEKALFTVLDDQRVKRNQFIMQYDPHGYAILQARERWGNKRPPFLDDLC